MSSSRAITCSGVSHGFAADSRVIAGLDLSVAEGEFVALVGPSGCGKSTLLSLIAGIDQPTKGEIAVFGHGDHRLGRATLMPQGDALLPWRTLDENLALAAQLAGRDRPRARQAVSAALDSVGLGDHGGYFPHALSGGMRQRGALARTLLADSRCWLLDEPFGALDALTRSQLQAHLAEVWSVSRPAVLLVTHDIDEALLVADRVVVASRRPMRVIHEQPVALPRPRSLELTTEPAFGEQKRALLDALGVGGVTA